jgi:hypothetical protein
MANGVNPLDFAVWQKDSELHVVVGFFEDCSIDCLSPFEAILRVYSIQPFFPIRRPLGRIETVNAVPFV